MSRFFPKEKMIYIKIDENTNINPYFYDYITEVAYYNRNHELFITFENLVSLKNINLIKEIIHNLNLRKQIKINYCITIIDTFLSEISSEDIKFFNENNIFIDWKIFNVKSIKNDIFKELVMCNNLFLSIVLDLEYGLKNTLDYLKIYNDKYFLLHANSLYFTFIDVASSNYNTDFLESDINYLLEYYLQCNNTNIQTYNTYIKNTLEKISNNYFDKFTYKFNKITLDINGNVYYNNIPCGTIFDDYYIYLTNIINADITNKNCTLKTFCQNLNCNTKEWCTYKHTEFNTIINFLNGIKKNI